MGLVLGPNVAQYFVKGSFKEWGRAIGHGLDPERKEMSRKAFYLSAEQNWSARRLLQECLARMRSPRKSAVRAEAVAPDTHSM